MRLAIIVSHPIQYYSPWFRHLAAAMGCTPRHEAIGERHEEECGKVGKWEGGKSERRDEETKGLRTEGAKEQNALRVFYLWDFGVTEKTDKGFGKAVKWDVDLLEGYDHEFVPNVSRDPGTHWFGGLENPELLQRVKEFAPDAVLQFGYNYKSLVNFDVCWNTKRAPLLFRGDSHLLAEGEQGIQHEAYGIRVKRWARNVGLRLLFRRFACFLAVGKANADYFRAHGVPESKIVRCPHVVDNAFFLDKKNASMEHGAWSREAEEKSKDTKGLKDQGLKGLRDLESRGLREELGISEDELVFLFAGKLEDKKQPLLLLEAFLAADLPKAALVFVGSGRLESKLSSRVAGGEWLVKGNGVFERGTTRVVFLEFQNQSAMPDVYRTGDVLVLPSKGRYETWGLAVNEAACCGLPAIVSSHVGCGPDLVEDGVTGWIFEAGNVAALQRTLEMAAANRERLAAMGETLKQRVTGEYSYQSATEALLKGLRQKA